LLLLERTPTEKVKSILGDCESKAGVLDRMTLKCQSYHLRYTFKGIDDAADISKTYKRKCVFNLKSVI
jgi:hypothetical protein